MIFTDELTVLLVLQNGSSFSRVLIFSFLFFQLIASTCLFMSSKLKDDPLKLRDVINVSHSTLYRASSPLELSDHYWAMRDAIVQAELLIMRMIRFQLSFPDPYKVRALQFSSKTYI